MQEDRSRKLKVRIRSKDLAKTTIEELQVQLVELRRTNKELQHEKRELNVKLAAAQNELAAATEDDLIRANEALRKHIEGLQNNRFTEVEEMVYLRWVNACLRYELRNAEALSEGKALQLNKNVSPNSQEKAKRLMLKYAGPDLLVLQAREEHSDCGYESSVDSACTPPSGKLSRSSKTASLIKKLTGWRKNKDRSEENEPETPPRRSVAIDGFAPSRRSFALDSRETSRMSFSVENGSKTASYGVETQSRPEALNSIAASFQIMSRSVASSELADKYPAFKDRHKLATQVELCEKSKDSTTSSASCNETLTADMKKTKAPRKPKPPPKPCSSGPGAKVATTTTSQVPPPPPPPPLSRGKKTKAASVQDEFRRAPEVIAFYQTFMKRDTRKDTHVSAGCNMADARSSMIGEIENRSSHLLAIKADVESQSEFVRSLAVEVQAAAFTNVEDVVAFVKWLDEELAFLVDERAVLKHFDWPERKADTLRECAFQYQDLKKLEQGISSSQDYSGMTRDAAMKAMQASLEKIEGSIYAVLRTRDASISRYKEFSIPTSWMLDTGLVGKIKQSSVKLAQHYMKRVVKELDLVKGTEPVREFLLLQGVRFAFRVHQFAGGFDRESMNSFEQLRNCACARG